MEEQLDQYECLQCGAYWFDNPPEICPFCGNDDITEMYFENY